MCERYVFTPSEPSLERWGRYTLKPDATMMPRWGAHWDWEQLLAPRYNVAPGQVVPVVTAADGLTLMRWGLIPSYARHLDQQGVINVMAEHVLTRSTFADAFAHRRLLVPATGFYEWHRDGPADIPMYFHLPDRPLFAFAGIYEEAHDSDGRLVRTFAIITAEANKLVRPTHTRMPVILTEAGEAVWASGKGSAYEFQALLDPYPADLMEAYRVGTAVNNPSAQGDELIARS